MKLKSYPGNTPSRAGWTPREIHPDHERRMQDINERSARRVFVIMPLALIVALALMVMMVNVLAPDYPAARAAHDWVAHLLARLFSN
ncbi:MAG TPA: hypothetical protein VMA75_02270 [Candidatus Paceibacterota bacterium]|nr:hypothetical protein [Candidatus Paceibacterota bacterium]